jgi:DNA-binding winged helix-turn-helix (wHTH) protein/tetratricopeptide (TPR) repeat protein
LVLETSNIAFGAYRADLEQRVLFRGTEPVSLTPRCFDMLALLLQNAGRVVSKEDLLQAVWGKTIVEDGTLTWHVHALRQALADGDDSARFIETVPKRGYRFVAPLGGPAPAFGRRASDRATDPAPAPAPRRTRRAIVMLGAVVLAVIALVFAMAMRSRMPALAYAERDWLLVTDFENRTGDARFDDALLTAFSVGLEQSNVVHVFPRTRVLTTLERMQKPLDTRIDESLAREICAREGIRALIVAAVTRTGKAYALAVRLVDPKSGEAVRSYVEQAADESGLLVALQKISNDVRRDLGESLTSIAASDRSLAEVTTPVFAALQNYSEGVARWNRAHYSEARRAFEAAVALDPGFAMAHAALGRLYYSFTMNRPDLGAEYFQRALALASKTTPRERAIITADFALARGRLDAARAGYDALLAQQPRDIELLAKRGDLEQRALQHADAARLFERALAIDPDNVKLLMNLGVARANLGESAAGLVPYERAIAADPTLLARHNFRYNYGFMLFDAGRVADARRLFVDSSGQGDAAQQSLRALGLFEQYFGRYGAAAEWYGRAVAAQNTNSDRNLARSRNQSYLANVLAAQGKRREALDQLRLAAASLDAHGKAPIVWRGRIAKDFARLGDIGAALEQQKRMLADADARDPVHVALTSTLAAEVEVARGRNAAACELAEKAHRGAPDADAPLLLETIGRACATAGESARAAAAWSELARIKAGWKSWEALQPRLLAHLELAKLERARGDVAAAKAALAPLAAIWKEADAELPAAREMRSLARALDGEPRQ